MKILIAEDDAVSRRLIESTLTNWGYDVIVAKNGIEAWEALIRRYEKRRWRGLNPVD
jgi:two-component system chemotaxis response regulator CheY